MQVASYWLINSQQKLFKENKEMFHLVLIFHFGW